jgi:hypothetical protein
MLTQQQIFLGIVWVAGLVPLDAVTATQVIYSASSVAEKKLGPVQTSPCKIYRSMILLKQFRRGFQQGYFGDFRSDYLDEYKAICQTVLSC